MTAAEPARCGHCGLAATSADLYCEACGAPLTPGVVVDLGDHREFDNGVAAGVTDRGLVHRRNEDAMHVARVGDAIVAIVCDGVSSAAAAADASAAAAEAAGAVLVASLDDPDADGSAPMRDAMTAAQHAVLGVPWTRTRRRGAPACTFLGARWNGRTITVGAVGDCRAYWIDDRAVEQLTVDDSWVQEQVAIGKLSESEAHGHPYEHAITRWLGEDAPGGAPRVTTFTPPSAGRLVLCSDGLWNYAPTNTRMGAIVRAHPPATPAIEVARALTQIALASGGRDNITVVVVDVVPSTVATANGEGLT